MPVFTVQQMINRASAIADIHDNFVSTQTWLDWFNDERRALAISMARGGILQDIQTNTIPAGQADEFNVIGEYLAVVSVYQPDTTSFRVRQLRIVPYVDNFFQLPGGAISGLAQSVSISDYNSDAASGFILKFFPRDPTNLYNVVLLKAPTQAITVDDTFAMPMGLEERVYLGMARRALVKEESDAKDVSRLIAEADQRVEEYVWGRSFAQAQSVRNVDSLQRGWGFGWGDLAFPSPDLWRWL